MIINCPECNLPVSDKAYSCPHCGYPLKPGRQATRRKTPARMRLPNGFGQISEIKNQNLRKPFRAMVTIGHTDTGRPISRILKPEGYFKTYNEAYRALLEYHDDPRALGDAPTLNDIFDKYIEQCRTKGLSESGIKAKFFAWNHCQEIAFIPVTELKTKHIKQCIDPNKNLSSSSVTHIKNLLNQMLDYCVEREVVSKNVAREYNVRTKRTPQNHHIPFEDWEMDILWQHKGENIYVDMILIDCYSGWRPTELVSLENANISDKAMTGGMKTDAGTNRTVPIHSKISPLIEKYRCSGNKYLFAKSASTSVTYKEYSYNFSKLILSYGLNNEHRPHDCRVHFVSALKNQQVNEYLIKRMVGHAVQDITESVYTHWDLDIISQELEKI